MGLTSTQQSAISSFGIMARQWGVPDWLTLAAGWTAGGMDTTADEATIMIGYRAVRRPPPSGRNLCEQINTWHQTWQNHASDIWTMLVVHHVLIVCLPRCRRPFHHLGIKGEPMKNPSIQPLRRIVMFMFGMGLLVSCTSVIPASYWPATPCPQPNTTDRDDICLVRHHYQTRDLATNLSALESAISPDGQWIAIGGNQKDGALPAPVLLVNYATGAVTELPHTSGSLGVAFSPDSQRLAAVGANYTLAPTGSIAIRDALVRVWDIPSGRLIRDLRAPYPVTAPPDLLPDYASVVFSPDGTRVIAGREVGDIVMWDVASGALIDTFVPARWADGADNLSISRDGTRLVASAQWDGPFVTVYDLPTARVLAELDVTTLLDDISWPKDVALSPDGRTVAIATGCHLASCRGTVWLWDLETQQIQALNGHVGDVLSVAFHPQGAWLASGGIDNSIRIWDWQTGQERYRMDGAVTPEILTGTPAPGIPQGAGGLGSATQGYWAPVSRCAVHQLY